MSFCHSLHFYTFYEVVSENVQNLAVESCPQVVHPSDIGHCLIPFLSVIVPNMEKYVHLFHPLNVEISIPLLQGLCGKYQLWASWRTCSTSIYSVWSNKKDWLVLGSSHNEAQGGFFIVINYTVLTNRQCCWCGCTLMREFEVYARFSI